MGERRRERGRESRGDSHRSRLPVSHQVHVDPLEKRVDALGHHLIVQRHIVHLGRDHGPGVVEPFGRFHGDAESRGR